MNTPPLTSQDKAINHSPIPQVWELYEYQGEIYAHSVTWLLWFRAADAYAVCYQIKGKTAHYTLCSHDNNVTRQMALSWATLHYAGRFRTLTIDLTPCNYEKVKK